MDENCICVSNVIQVNGGEYHEKRRYSCEDIG